MPYPGCETCQHWQPRAATVARVNPALGKMEQKVVGECHRLPPLKSYEWPLTLPADFCGEHQDAKAMPAVGASAPAKGAKGGKGKAPVPAPAQEPLLPASGDHKPE